MSFNLPLLGGALAVLLVSAIGVPVAALRRKKRREQSDDRLSWFAWAGVFAMLAFVAGWLVLTMNLLRRFYLFNDALDPWLRLLHLIGLLGVAGAIVTTWRATRAWRAGRPWRVRLGTGVVALAMLWMTWFAIGFKLLTVSLKY